VAVEGRITVVPEAPARLEAVVRAAMPRLSRRLVRRLISEGAVRVNGRKAAKGALVGGGDRVTLPDLPTLAPEAHLAVPIVYEDADLVILDKPGGMRGHAIDPRQRGTAVAFLLARYPEASAIGDALAPGLVHRLDTGTSGLLAAARTASAYAALRAAFRRGAVEKHYLAVVSGTPHEPGRISLPLAHDRRDRRRMTAAAPGERAWRAVTDFTVRAVAPDRAVVEARMQTGVTHQIRAHLAAIGHPVLGDPLYGGPPAGLSAGRHALHAAGLRFIHPRDRRQLELWSELPEDLRRLMA
jgi:23S rRNA pseudouridine1911/1915/1917 synthase